MRLATSTRTVPISKSSDISRERDASSQRRHAEYSVIVRARHAPDEASVLARFHAERAAVRGEREHPDEYLRARSHHFSHRDYLWICKTDRRDIQFLLGGQQHARQLSLNCRASPRVFSLMTIV